MIKKLLDKSVICFTKLICKYLSSKQKFLLFDMLHIAACEAYPKDEIKDTFSPVTLPSKWNTFLDKEKKGIIKRSTPKTISPLKYVDDDHPYILENGSIDEKTLKDDLERNFSQKEANDLVKLVKEFLLGYHPTSHPKRSLYKSS